MNLSERIERWMLHTHLWSGCDHIAVLFGTRKRNLRQRGSKPGLCSDYAISSDLGLKHVTRATVEEYREWRHAEWRHVFARIRRLRKMDKRRRNVMLAGVEADTGQQRLAM